MTSEHQLNFSEFEQQKLTLPLEGLNEAQQKAVYKTEGPLLVLAGAGTGKTKVLTTRISHILAENLAMPGQILAVTFTNKAAGEMRQRVEQMVGGRAEGLWLGTFHSIALRMLRQHPELVGLKSDFTIIDQDDALRLVKQIMAENNIDDKQLPPKAVLSTIERFKDRALDPKKAAGERAEGSILKIYEAYQRRMLTLGVVDFGDLLMHCINLLRENPQVLEEYHRRFRYILVDEYQDTNVAQYLWLRLLAQESHNICCVGDDDQSIYGWRGAEIENILRFEKDFTGAEIIRLEQNYRSTQHILAAAAALIANNKSRLGKTLFCEENSGDKVKLVSLWDEQSEARYVGQEIETLQKFDNQSLNEMAILVRAGFQTRAFEECFMSMGIPYRVIGGLRFYERMEIRDAIAYMRVIAQPDNDLALERIINTPKRGIGNSTLDALREHARMAKISLYEAINQKITNNELRPKIRNSLKILMDGFARWRELLKTSAHYEVIDIMLKESGYVNMWKTEKTPDAAGRVENLNELITALEEFENLAQFLEHVSLVTDGDEGAQNEMVSIMTMHGAKGLEFETVFLTGWEEGLFPSQRSIDENGQKGLEEERRLAYVGVTRAKRNLAITFSSNRRVYGQWLSSIPSRFIDELPKENIETLNVGGPSYSPHKGKEKQRQTPRESKPKTSGFQHGERIFHQKFGYGRILEVSGKHLKIKFEKTDTKILMEDYVKKA